MNQVEAMEIAPLEEEGFCRDLLGGVINTFIEKGLTKDCCSCFLQGFYSELFICENGDHKRETGKFIYTTTMMNVAVFIPLREVDLVVDLQRLLHLHLERFFEYYFC